MYVIDNLKKYKIFKGVFFMRKNVTFATDTGEEFERK